MVEFIIGGLIGILGWLPDEAIERWETTPRTWKNLTRYGTGVVMTSPVYMLIRKAMGLSADIKDLAAYYMAFMSVGFGVAVRKWYLNDRGE